MKKFLLSAMILIAFTACKKENKITENTDTTPADSVTVAESNEISEAIIPFKQIELSPEETSEILANKQHET